MTPPAGPGQHGGHRLARGGGEGRHAAVRLHDVFLPRGEAGLVEAAVELRDVARQDRLQVGVDDGRAQPVDTRGSAARSRRRARCCSPASPRATISRTRASCSRMQEREQQADRERLDLLRRELAHGLAQRRLVERRAARCRGNRRARFTSPVQALRHQQRRLVVHHVEDRRAIGPRLLADRIDAAEAFGHQQAGAHALAFEQRVGADRGAVAEIGDVGRPHALAEQRLDAGRMARDGSSGVDGTLRDRSPRRCLR